MAIPNKPFYLSAANTEFAANGNASNILSKAGISAPRWLGDLGGMSAYIVPVVANPLRSPSPDIKDAAEGMCEVYFDVNSNGTWSGTGIDGSFYPAGTQYQSGTWLIAGKATDVEVRITHTGGTSTAFYSNAAATWVDLSVTRRAVLRYTRGGTAGTSGTSTLSFTVEFREKSTGTIKSTTTGCILTARSTVPI